MSRKGANDRQGKRTNKFEYRNPKFETNSNDQNKNGMFQTASDSDSAFNLASFWVCLLTLFRISSFDFGF